MALYSVGDDIAKASETGNLEFAERLCRFHVDEASNVSSNDTIDGATAMHRLSQILFAQGKKAESAKLRQNLAKLVYERYSPA